MAASSDIISSDIIGTQYLVSNTTTPSTSYSGSMLAGTTGITLNTIR